MGTSSTKRKWLVYGRPKDTNTQIIVELLKQYDIGKIEIRNPQLLIEKKKYNKKGLCFPIVFYKESKKKTLIGGRRQLHNFLVENYGSLGSLSSSYESYDSSS